MNAVDQLDENGNPNWILVNVPQNAIAADGTYTIPAEYIRGSQVSIKGDMQQAYEYTLKITGAKGKGRVLYDGKEYKSGKKIYVSQFFTADDVVAISVKGYTAKVSLDAQNKTIVVEYNKN